jgi:hypothetical protein
MTPSSAGVVSGVPGAPGFFGLTVLATDAAGVSNEQLCLLRVLESVSAPAGLVGWWRAEGNALDSAGTNHGALRGGAGFAAGKVGEAFLLNGKDACIEIPDTPALRPVSFTLEAWVAFDVISGPQVLQVLFAKPVGTGTNNSYALWLIPGSINGGIGDAAAAIGAPFSPEPGSWHHVAYTFDHDVKQQALYVNGIQVAIQSGVMRTIGYDAQPLLLGRGRGSGIPSFPSLFLQGRIDEASIYNRALSGAEIAAIFDAGPAGKRL